MALWYHFGFLVISTALLGFDVAGTAPGTMIGSGTPVVRALFRFVR